LVKTIKFANPNYLGDPINAVKIFNEKMADELCILDITRKKTDIDYDYLHDIATEAFMPLSYGGGISSLDQIKKLFKIGFEKVIINSSLVSNPDLIKAAVDYAGSQSIVASIDVKKSIFHGITCFINNGTHNTKIHPLDLAAKAEKAGVGEVLLNVIDRDGMMNGYDLELISEISSKLKIPLIACGGAGSLADISSAIQSGAQAAAAGSLFVYYGAKKAVLINYPTEAQFIEAGIYKE
jgi:cyclase